MEVAGAAGPSNSLQPVDTYSSISPYVQSVMCYLQFMVNGYLIQQRVVFRFNFVQAQLKNHCLGINGKTYEGSGIFKVCIDL